MRITQYPSNQQKSKVSFKWGQCEKKEDLQDFPGGAVEVNSTVLPIPCAPNAGGWGLGARSLMHATTGISHATTREPACRNWGAHVLQIRSW